MPYKNIKQQRQKQKEYATRNKLFINRYKHFIGCQTCGFNDVKALDLHHINPQNKTAEISEAKWIWSIAKLKTEMRKCKVLCANCHRILA